MDLLGGVKLAYAKVAVWRAKDEINVGFFTSLQRFDGEERLTGR